jgi:hypothetical protein
VSDRARIRIGNATLSASMVDRLASRRDEELGVALVAAGAAPDRVVETLLRPERRAALAVFAGLRSAAAAEAVERPALLAARHSSSLARLACRARRAATDAASLQPPRPKRPAVTLLPPLLYPTWRRR